ncbi:hypothetical protein COY26_01200 [Candidatus Woesearchaeota archaeon CG_4_10_14_0_2_um_filter_33_10]|nr:MAG: hypothetical protein COY26_01200 [Candidatus Woesearchaeota archaeon CG_4_10_14_0_2_um_filter_33_10]
MIRIIEKMADARNKDAVYDLGSGDGRVLEGFARRGIKCIGIEQNPLLNRIARKKLGMYKKVEIVKGDIFGQDLSKASIIIAYLSRYLTKDLQKKIKKECKKGTKIILVSYRFDEWEYVKMEKWFWLPIRLYVV